MKTKLTHDIMINRYGFTQVDWFYNKGEFEIGFLFYKSLKGEKDAVDIFYGEYNSLFAIELEYCEDLEFLYKLITKKDLI